MRAVPRFPAVEEILTMRPPLPCLIICMAAAFEQRYVPITFTSKTVLKTPSSTSITGTRSSP